MPIEQLKIREFLNLQNVEIHGACHVRYGSVIKLSGDLNENLSQRTFYLTVNTKENLLECRRRFYDERGLKIEA